MCVYVYYYSISTGLNVKVQFILNSTSQFMGELFKRMPLTLACFYFIFGDISLSVMSQYNPSAR